MEKYEYHGGPADRGSADAYYWRERDPHKYPEGTGNGEKVTNLTPEEFAAYNAAYDDAMLPGKPRKCYGGKQCPCCLAAPKPKIVIRKVKPKCFGKHCDESKNLRKYQCFNRYYITEDDIIQEKSLCDDCAAIDGYVHTKCWACSNTYTYTQMMLLGGAGFTSTYKDKRWFCNACIKDINKRSFYIDD